MLLMYNLIYTSYYFLFAFKKAQRMKYLQNVLNLVNIKR